ncbi:DMT family transporter [Pectobacterium aroidearum]|uniref:DMT family transporter n=1 Tax=Pectobacterium aroidearum TaxID=1201031 RepID=UPI0015EFEB84|nr:DMT family transporter [Pectobacterium aroidearum]MBA5234954.1 DMT family transporter [Pectobacterium aroidearum]
MGNIKNIFLAILSGFFLTLMFQSNSVLSENTSPLVASWVAHGIGTLVSLLLVIFFVKKSPPTLKSEKNRRPVWLYLGGIPGAFTVVLAVMAINGGLSLSSTISLGLAGQLLFGFVSDYFGLFGSQKRKLSRANIYIFSLIISGCFLIIYDL